MLQRLVRGGPPLVPLRGAAACGQQRLYHEKVQPWPVQAGAAPAVARRVPPGQALLLTQRPCAQVIDHYERPRNVGSLNKADPAVGTGLVGAPACGDVMKLQIRVDGEGRIAEAKFKTFGCGSAIASSSLATEWIRGKTLEEAGAIRNTQIAKELCLPPVKLHCSMLAEDAIKSAISDYRAKVKAREDLG